MQKLTEAKFLEWLYTDLPIFHRDYVSADDDGLTMIDYEGLLGSLVNIYEEVDCDKFPIWWGQLNRMMDYCEDHMSFSIDDELQAVLFELAQILDDFEIRLNNIRFVVGIDYVE